MSPVEYEFPRPALTADVVCFAWIDGRVQTLLVRRAHDPFVNHWAFPGGFVDADETPIDAARRELREETGLTVAELTPVRTFGDPGRDPRGWVVSAAFYAVVAEAQATVRAGDDAAAARWTSIDRLPQLAFDHHAMLRAACARLVADAYLRPILRTWLPGEFSPMELVTIYRQLSQRREEPKAATLVRRLRDADVIDRVGARCYRFA